MPDRLNYAFRNGWVDTGDLPCRQALRAELPGRAITLPDMDFSEVHLGSHGDFVDFSGFCTTPTLRERFARCAVYAPSAQTISLRVETCGGVHIWLGAKKVCVFEPFERNTKRSCEFTTKVSPGWHYLTVRFEDLHERDTVYGFGLRLLEGTGLRARIDTSASEASLAAAVCLLEGLRAETLFNNTGEIAVTSDTLPTQAVRLTCVQHPQFSGELCKDNPTIPMQLPAGFHLLTFRAELGGGHIMHNIGVTVLEGLKQLSGGSITDRKAELLQRHQCDNDIAEVLYCLWKGQPEEHFRQPLDAALTMVERREDCADFRMMCLLWIWHAYRENLSHTTFYRLRDALLGFRYWMDEPGNDVMWFWSENHALCFHVAQALSGQLFPDDIFESTGKTGVQNQREGEERLHKWFDAIEAHGLAEWNSAAYYPINYRALLVLHEITNSTVLKSRAKLLLDQISAMVALHSSAGVPSGSQGRIYTKEIFAGPMTELGALAAVMFGGWHAPGKDAPAVMLALSRYAPPAHLAQFALPVRGDTLQAQYQQGLEPGSLALYKTQNVQLSTASVEKVGEPGHQQHMIDIQFAADPMARLWINHPGEPQHWGKGRPSFWAGNGRLPKLWHRNTIAALQYDLQPDDVAYTHAFIPRDRLDEVICDNRWLFVRSGRGYCAIWAASPPELRDKGAFGGCEWRLTGNPQHWVAVVGDAEIDGSFSAFCNRCRETSPKWRGGRPVLTTRWGTVGLDAPDTHPTPEGIPVDPHISRSDRPYRAWYDYQE